MTTLPDQTLQTLQHEVQRLLGRCVMRIQQYEHLIKSIVAHQDISGPVHTLEAVRDKRITDTSRKTLGILVGELLGSGVVAEEAINADKEMTNFPEDGPSVRMGSSVELRDADFARVKKELKEFVSLRNNLVHHFIDKHDLRSLGGCRGAQDALVAASSRIDQHLEELREWAEGMVKARQVMAGFIQSDDGREFMANGIARVGIESAFLEAASELAVDGWAPIMEAGRWVVERHPEQTLAKCGYSSWPQVVHESGILELRYLEIDGKRVACYREKE